MNILITGVNGFIGRSLCPYLKEKGYRVQAAIRKHTQIVSGVDQYFEVGDINESTDWQKALTGVDIVIHLAARVHVMNDSAVDPLNAFRQVNVFGTERLARMAAKAGVKRFIFISSIKVNGEGSSSPYTEKDIFNPQDAYGISKREAEELLARVAAETKLKTVILRIPLVYGPGVKANFRNLINIVGAGLPLPFKNVRNHRSLIYLGNLMDAISVCMTHPLAIGETFIVSDGQDVSTPDLMKQIAFGMDKKLILFSFHPVILKAFCKIAGKTEEWEKLTGSLCVDSSKIRRLLGWKPPFTFEEGVKETVKYKL